MAEALSTILEFAPETSLACVTVCYRWESDLGAEFANSAHGATSCAPRQTRYSSSNWVTKYISRGDPPIAQNGFRGRNPWGEWGRRHQCGHGRCAGCWRTGSVAG